MGTGERGSWLEEIARGFGFGGKKKMAVELPLPPKPDLAPPSSSVAPRRFDQMPPVVEEDQEPPPKLPLAEREQQPAVPETLEQRLTRELIDWLVDMKEMKVERSSGIDFGFEVIAARADEDGKNGWVVCVKDPDGETLKKGMPLKDFLVLNFKGPNNESVEGYDMGQAVLAGGSKVELNQLQKKE